MENSKIVNISDEAEFEDTISKNKVAMVDFGADWCGPCQMLMPVMDHLADSYKGKAVIAKVDVDKNQKLAIKHNVMSIPTVILFKKGEQEEKFVGVHSEVDYEDALYSALNKKSIIF